MNAIDRSHDQDARDPFYWGMSLFFLVTVLAGFARSFYLQNYFEFPRLPIHLVVHGTVLTAWFILACAQPVLIKIRHRRLHRRVGMAALFIAAGVVASGVLTVAMRDAPTIAENPTRAAGNLASLFMFLFCVVLGFLFRRRSGHHKRLMLMASIPIVAPAVDRFARIPLFNDLLGKALYWFPAPPEIAFATLNFLALLLAVVTHDLIRERRVHPGTMWGLVAILVAAPIATATIVSTGAWVAFVQWSSQGAGA